MRRYFVTALALVSIYGCVPATTTYYKPNATVGRNAHGDSAAIAPADVWEVKIGQATVRTRMTRRFIAVSVAIPSGSQAAFVTTEIQVTSSEGQEVKTMQQLTYMDDKTRLTRVVSAAGMLEGGNISLRIGKGIPREYSTSLELGITSANEYEVRLPDLVVNGETHSFGPVRFSRKRGVGLFFING